MPAADRRGVGAGAGDSMSESKEPEEQGDNASDWPQGEEQCAGTPGAAASARPTANVGARASAPATRRTATTRMHPEVPRGVARIS